MQVVAAMQRSFQAMVRRHNQLASVCRWHNAQVRIMLPTELADLLALYMRRGHPVLCDSSYPYVFMDKKGRHMADPAVMTEYWRYLLARMGSPTYFPPHRYKFSRLHTCCTAIIKFQTHFMHKWLG